MKATVAATKVEGMAEDVGGLPKLTASMTSLKFTSPDDPWSFESDAPADHPVRSAAVFCKDAKARIEACLKTLAKREEGTFPPFPPNVAIAKWGKRHIHPHSSSHLSSP